MKERLCDDIKHLKKIEISPSNNQFVFKENQYLLGKSDQHNDEFDILIFANGDIKTISIPSNIKIISSFAFAECKHLRTVIIPQNSNLHTNENDSFTCSRNF